jgi:DNA repair photolyase
MPEKIGITERGDAGIDLSWRDEMDNIVFTIVITKSVNDKFIEEVMKHAGKIIVHATVTGYGGTILEPNVRDYMWSYFQILKLLEKGFDPNHIVLRMDPVIVTEKGIKVCENVLKTFCCTGIKRVRYSYLDMYNHVKERFKKAGLPIPYDDLPGEKMIKKFMRILKKFNYEYESCAENNSHQLGCISQKDLDVLGLNIELMGSKNQRKGCLCPSNKYEMLKERRQCPHKCLYCYWITK